MSSDRPTGLLRLLDLPALHAFFEDTWEQRTRLARGAIQPDTAEIFTLDNFEVLMAGAPADGGASLSIVENHMARPVTANEAEPTRLPTLYDAFQRGCTLLQSGLQVRWPALGRLCREVENQILGYGFPLAESVGANAYLTPADAQGFEIHYDNHCALILQIHGSKNWSVFEPLDDMPIARCERPILREALGPPLLATRLMQGDVLYIPRGFPHYASTASDTSLHVTLSLRPMIWAEAIRALCETDPAFRRSARAGSEAYFSRELVVRLASMDVSSLLERRVSEGLSKLCPLPSGGLRAVEAAAGLGPDTRVTRAPDVVCSAKVEASAAVLRFPGATLRLPAEMQPVFAFIAEHDEFTPAMLPEIESDYDRVKLVQILTKRGLLRVETVSALAEAL